MGYTTHFIKSAIAVTEAIGLEFISSEKQIRNGSLVFHDPESNTVYGLYLSGYVRRHSGNRMYQLNKTTYGHKVTEYNGQTYTHWGKIRLLVGPDEGLGILVQAVVRWRHKRMTNLWDLL